MPKKSDLDTKELSKAKSASAEAKKTKTTKTKIEKVEKTVTPKKTTSKNKTSSSNKTEKTAAKKATVKKSTTKESAKESASVSKKVKPAKDKTAKAESKKTSTKKLTPKEDKTQTSASESQVTTTQSASIPQKTSFVETVKNIPAGEYMCDAHKEFFKNLLENWRAELIEDSLRTEEYMRSEKPQTADLNDRASQEEEFYLELRTRERERKLIDKINKALMRLSRNDFGWCEHCGEEIGLNRLVARPTAELCIDCKELAERKEKSFLH